MDEQKQQEDGKGYTLEIDANATNLFEKMKDDVTIERSTWISLTYTSDCNLQLQKSGSHGFEEAVKKGVVEDEVSFLVVKGLKSISKKAYDTIFLLISWIPESITSLKRVTSILDIDDLASGLGLTDFNLIEPKSIDELNMKHITKRLREQSANQSGKYIFDKKVFPLLCRQALRKKKKTWKNPTEKEIEKIKKGESHVLREILTTEFTYVTSLNLFMDYFALPLKLHGYNSLYKKVTDNLQIIIDINTKFLTRLMGVYDLTSDDVDLKSGSKSQKKLKSIVDGLGADFFTNEKIIDVMNVFLETCPDFRKYSIYVNSYAVILQEMDKKVKIDATLKSDYQSTSKTLFKQGERCTDYAGFLIMPIQRIPRLELLCRELLRSSHVEICSAAIPTIERAMKKIQEVGDTINARKETNINAMKTVFLSKLLMKPYLMEQMCQKFRYCHIKVTKNKKKNKKRNSKSKEKMIPGIVYVFRRCILIMKTKNSSAFEIDDLLSADVDKLMKKNKTTLYAEIPLDDPNVRCSQGSSGRTEESPTPNNSIIVIEQIHLMKEYVLVFPNSGDCGVIVNTAQKLMSEYHTELISSQKKLQQQVQQKRTKTSAITTTRRSERVLFQSKMLWREEKKYKKKNTNTRGGSGGSGSGGVKDRDDVLCVIHANDLKVKIYGKEEEEKKKRKRKRGLLSNFSIIGAKYGKYYSIECPKTKTNKEYEANEQQQTNKRRSMDDINIRRTATTMTTTNNGPDRRLMFRRQFSMAVDMGWAVGQVKKEEKEEEEDNEEEGEDSYWFYVETPNVITKKASFVKLKVSTTTNGKRRSKEKKNEKTGLEEDATTTSSSSRRYIFRVQKMEDMLTWFGIFERLECSREDVSLYLNDNDDDFDNNSDYNNRKNRKNLLGRGIHRMKKRMKERKDKKKNEEESRQLEKFSIAAKRLTQRIKKKEEEENRFSNAARRLGMRFKNIEKQKEEKIEEIEEIEEDDDEFYYVEDEDDEEEYDDFSSNNPSPGSGSERDENEVIIEKKSMCVLPPPLPPRRQKPNHLLKQLNNNNNQQQQEEEYYEDYFHEEGEVWYDHNLLKNNEATNWESKEDGNQNTYF